MIENNKEVSSFSHKYGVDRDLTVGFAHIIGFKRILLKAVRAVVMNIDCDGKRLLTEPWVDS